MTFSLEEADAVDADASPSSISCRLRMYSTAQRNVSTLLTLRLLLDEDDDDERPLPSLLLLQNDVGMC